MDFWDKALSFIFPPICGVCGKIGKSYLCKECKEELEKEKIIVSKIEKQPSEYIIEHCYLFCYEGDIRQKILQYKFQNKAYLSKMFSEFFVKNEKVCRFLKKYDIIISVPMSKKKKSQRGYNQSELIAKQISKYTKISFQNQVLIKYKENHTQSTLSKKQRFENVKNVYKIQNEQKIKEKNILLFDDIYTTGATVKECAKVLKQAGAKNIGILTVAKDFQKV
ncbi:MAG: ComF family protein [Clostridia bacterium]|jgi:competence protein ComFC|nr:ComF family protein [Clostridia bacterium]